jgi:hypothetical protein
MHDIEHIVNTMKPDLPSVCVGVRGDEGGNGARMVEEIDGKIKALPPQEARIGVCTRVLMEPSAWPCLR